MNTFYLGKEHFGDCDIKTDITTDIKTDINTKINAQLKDCKVYENVNYIGNINYKELRIKLWNNVYEPYFKRITNCNKEKEYFDYMLQEADELYELNGKKRENIKNLQVLINKQNTELMEFDKKISEHKNYNEIKQNRIINSAKVKSASFMEYYIFIILIVVFLVIQIGLLVF